MSTKRRLSSDGGDGDDDEVSQPKVACLASEDEGEASSSLSSSSGSSSLGSEIGSGDDGIAATVDGAEGGDTASGMLDLLSGGDDDDDFDVSNSSSRQLDNYSPNLNTPEVDAAAAAEPLSEASSRQQEGGAMSPLSSLVHSINIEEFRPPPPPPPQNDDLEAPPPLPADDEPPAAKPPEPDVDCEEKRRGVREPEEEEEEEEEGEWASEDESELFEMLESSVRDESKEQREQMDSQPIHHVERTKTFLVEKGKNHFDVLPLGWLKVRHRSGMPMYLHRETRVMTLSRPYALGKCSVARHSIPLGAIPCLNYKRAMEEEESEKEQREAEQKHWESKCPQQEEQQRDEEEAAAPSAQRRVFPRAKISSLYETRQSKSLSVDEFKDYCKRLFQLREVKSKRFSSWKDKRIYHKRAVAKLNEEHIAKMKQLEKPSLPDGLKLITIPVLELEMHSDKMKDGAFNRKVTKKAKKDWVLNPKGKSPVCILHEYLQQSIKKPPQYKYAEVESSSTPYSATVLIDGVEYGKGVGSSKKQSKSEAARLTLEILIPEFKDAFGREMVGGSNTLNELPDVSFFDSLRIEDPRVSDLCQRVGEPSPYAILDTCLRRNFGQGDINVETSLVPKRNKRNEFIMKVNNREVSVICRNKRDGKQFAAQKLLQLLHPQLSSWSSVLRLYGSRSISAQKLKKEKESEVTALQSRSSSHPAPNLAILEKLRTEMKLLAKKKRTSSSSKPAGKLTVSDAYVSPDLPSIGSSDKIQL